MTADQAFEELLKQGVIYQPPKDAIFDYVDAVLKHEVNKSFDLLEQCYAVGESTIVLLSVLYTNIKQVLQVQSCKSNDIVKSTGLTGWQIKCAKEKMGHYSIGDLVYMLKLVRDTEMKIKTGEIEEQMAVPYVMVNIF
jgi:DNA polymerase III delta subunit